MTKQDKDIARVRGLIFESVSRPVVFETLLTEVDALATEPKSTALDALSPDFTDATTTANQAASIGQGAIEIQFSMDRKGRVLTGSAQAISLFGLLPGERLHDRLGDSGRDALDDLIAGRRSQIMFTLFAESRPRPMLVLAKYSAHETIEAYAVLVRWNSAVAPLLREGFSLTDAEVDIVELLFQGNSPKDIARRRDRSPETVRTQLRTICRKTDTHGHMDLVHLVYGLMATADKLQARHGSASRGHYMLELPSGRHVDVETTGPADGKPLLYLHGCMGGRRLPQQALAALSHRRIIAPGRPGHGQTPADPDLSPQDIARDTIAILDHFNVQQTEVLSYNLGLPYALWLDAVAPGLVSSMTCLSPIPPLTRWADLMALPTEPRVFATLTRLNPAAARYLALLGGQRILQRGTDGVGKILFNRAKCDLAKMDADTETQRLFWHGHAWHVERGPDGFLTDARLSSTSWDNELTVRGTPIQFVVGAHDLNVPPAALNRLAHKVGASISTIPNAGHTLLHADPELWLRFIKN